MQHRDRIIIGKIVSEISIGLDMLGTAALKEFEKDEKLKRAVSMTVINIGELIKILQMIQEKNTHRYLGKL